MLSFLSPEITAFKHVGFVKLELNRFIAAGRRTRIIKSLTRRDLNITEMRNDPLNHRLLRDSVSNSSTLRHFGQKHLLDDAFQ